MYHDKHDFKMVSSLSRAFGTPKQNVIQNDIFYFWWARVWYCKNDIIKQMSTYMYTDQYNIYKLKVQTIPSKLTFKSTNFPNIFFSPTLLLPCHIEVATTCRNIWSLKIYIMQQ